MEAIETRLARDDEHRKIQRFAEMFPPTRAYGNRTMFTPTSAYEKGYVRVAEQGRELVGFSVVRHKITEPVTVLYLFAVAPRARRKGLGRRLIEEVMAASPHTLMRLNVEKDNPAQGFYLRLGFRPVGEALEGKAWSLEKEFPKCAE